MEIATWPEADVPAPLRRQVVALQDQAWPGAGPSSPAPWHDPALDPLSVLLLDGERVVAALDVLSKPLHHRGHDYRASGLSAVVTDVALRRRGLGLQLVRAALATVRASGADLVLFTCDAPLAPFYEAAGCTVLPGTVVIGGTPAEPFGSDVLGKVALAVLLSDHARAHAADFTGARIELHPGAIDRLW